MPSALPSTTTTTSSKGWIVADLGNEKELDQLKMLGWRNDNELLQLEEVVAAFSLLEREVTSIQTSLKRPE